MYLYNIQARFACLRCVNGGHLAPEVVLIKYMRDSISKYVYPTVVIDNARKITNFDS